VPAHDTVRPTGQACCRITIRYGGIAGQDPMSIMQQACEQLASQMPGIIDHRVGAVTSATEQSASGEYVIELTFPSPAVMDRFLAGDAYATFVKSFEQKNARVESETWMPIEP
jgi:hypothetical protein